MSYCETFFGVTGQLNQVDDMHPLFAPRASGTLTHPETGDTLVRYGLVRPTLLPLFDISGIDIFAFECVKFPSNSRTIKVIPPSDYPGTHRELNVLTPEETPVSSLLRIIEKSHSWISHLSVSEIYRDPIHIGEGMKSVVIGFDIADPDETITDEQA